MNIWNGLNGTMLASNQGVLRKSGITSGKDIVNESNKNSAGEIVSPLATCEDEVLIQMAVAGRNDCFSLLMCRHLAAVKKQIRFLISNEADVEDVVQEVVLRVWLHLPTFRSESNLRTWMIRIGINQARQLYRRRKSRPESQAVTDFAVIMSQEESPHQQLLRTETIETVRCAVAKLPPRYREVELGELETAQHLQMSIHAVKTRLFRARRKLSTRLSGSVTAYVKPHRAELARN